jgi:Domain of unknown function (DUF4129)
VAKRGWVLLLTIGSTALLALVGAASHGRPLSTWGHGHGPTPTFVDYAFTTVLIVLALAIALTVFAATQTERTEVKRRPRALWKSMLLFVALVAAATFIARDTHFATKLHDFLHSHPARQGKPPAASPTAKQHPGAHTAGVRWDEVAVFAALAAAAVAYLLWGRAHAPRRELPTDPDRTGAAMTVLLDDAVDDLRNEQDVRRAVIAAYARMELALGAQGLPRLQSEAPLEFLDRALRRLDVSAGSVRRLTDLFEWAKFSHHEPEPGMKDEAIDALLAVRDELRASEKAAA